MSRIQQLEQEIAQRTAELHALLRAAQPDPVKDYTFHTCSGPTSLLKLFGDKDILLAIHNMGQGCRYCTLWADGLNGLVPHLESRVALVLLSKDPPELQRTFANSRGWRFRMASHAGSDYIREQSAVPGHDNAPGLVCYRRSGSTILRAAATPFGPGDLFCPLWHMLGLAGITESDWTPQFSYWRRPAKLDDGGANLPDPHAG